MNDGVKVICKFQTQNFKLRILYSEPGTQKSKLYFAREGIFYLTTTIFPVEFWLPAVRR